MVPTSQRIVLVHPFCTHYTKGLFEELSRRFDARFIFFSDGGEWFWQKEHGVHRGEFSHEYLAGFRLGGVRIAPSLPWKLLREPAEVIVSSIDGKFALPMAYVAARLKGVPFLLWTGMWSRGDTLFNKLLSPINNFFYRHADALIVYGEHVKHYLVRQGVNAERIFVAKHSVDNEYYNRHITDAEKSALRERLGIPPGMKIVLFLGRLEEVKGVRYLINAMASLSLPDAVLLIAGDGSQRDKLESIARTQSPAGRIFFAGYVSVEGAVPYYSIADVCVIPSITVPTGKELWGLVANEAFNQGVPVIATDTVGAAVGGFIQDSVNGFVVPERDSASLAAAILRVLGDSSLREKLSVNASSTVAQWTHGHMAEGFSQAIEFASRKSGVSASEKTERPLTMDNTCLLCGAKSPAVQMLEAFRRCRRCGLMFRDPMPDLEQLDALYGQSWAVPAERPAETGGTTHELAREYAKRLTVALGRRDLKGLRLLEHGAGRGEFLRVLQGLGAEVYGLDPYGKAYLEEQGLRAYATLDEVPQQLRFDGIVSIDVVEHEFAAWNVLHRLQALLKPGGWLYVATPNSAGLNARLFGANWREARKPGHLVFFEPKTLERVLRDAGFTSSQRLRWNISYGESLLTRAKDSLLNLLGLDGELRYLAFRPDEERA